MKRRMYATVRRYEGVTEPDAATKQVDNIFVPLISALPGFVEYYWIDLTGGTMISVTIFKTLADAIHANNQARNWQKQYLSSVLPVAVRIDAGMIVVHK